MARAIRGPISFRRVVIDPVVADDQTLVRRAQVDRQAFGLLYERYLPRVYRFCAIRLRTRELAEDATAQIFSKALLSLERCDPERFRAWLFAIASNVVNDLHRAHRTVESLDAAASISDNAPAPDEIAIRNDDERRVLDLLDELTAEQREIVELRLAGLTGVEIAAALDRNPGAIRAAQFRAYARLRVLLNGQEPETGASR